MGVVGGGGFCDSGAMGWEEEMFTLFEDLEGRAEAEFAAERDLEVAERTVIEYRQVTWSARLHAALGHDLTVRLDGVGMISGRLLRTGDGWFLLESGQASWVVFETAVQWLSGLGPRSVPRAARGVAAGLGIGSPLRSLAEDGRQVLWHLRDGQSLSGSITRVGADFVELLDEGGRSFVAPWHTAVAVRSL